MEWDTDLNKTKPKKVMASPFQALGNSLWRSYLLIMMSIWLISDVIVYQFFAHSLYKQLDQRLLNLADAAAHSLNEIQQNPQSLGQQIERPIDDDQDLDISWQNLQQPQQSLEWFDKNGQRVANSGHFILTTPLKTGFESLNQNKIRSLTVVVYNHDSKEKILEGYVRASETTQIVDVALNQLQWGLALGGLASFGLMSLGGIWLTRKSIKPVEKSFQQLKQFTADASHELRSPLTVIQTSVAVMQSHPERIHPLDHEKLQGIISATQQIIKLVEDLLLLARNDAQIIPNFPQGSLIPLRELLEDVLEQHELQAEAKEISLMLGGNTSAIVRGDSQKLWRLFTNLVENALQYTPLGGKITVNSTIFDKKVIVTVKDTGIGIAAEHLPFIFDRFWRADMARSYREEGSGLGLAIVKAIALEHKGDVSVKSILGKGTCFTVWLPLAK